MLITGAVGMANGTADAPCVFVSVSGPGNGGVCAGPWSAVLTQLPRAHSLPPCTDGRTFAPAAGGRGAVLSLRLAAHTETTIIKHVVR